MYSFDVFIRHVTGQNRGDRALKDFKCYLVADFIRSYPNAPRPQIEKTAEEWAEAIICIRKLELVIDGAYADLVRQEFLKFKKADKSRKAKESRSVRENKRKTHKWTAQEQKKLFRQLELVHGREGAKMFMQEAKAKIRKRKKRTP